MCGWWWGAEGRGAGGAQSHQHAAGRREVLLQRVRHLPGGPAAHPPVGAAPGAAAALQALQDHHPPGPVPPALLPRPCLFGPRGLRSVVAHLAILLLRPSAWHVFPEIIGWMEVSDTCVRLVRGEADVVAVRVETGGCCCGGNRDGYVRMTRSKLMYRVVFPFTLKVTRAPPPEVAKPHRLPSHSKCPPT